MSAIRPDPALGRTLGAIRSRGRGTVGRLRSSRALLAGTVLVTLLVLVAIFAPLLAPNSPDQIGAGNPLTGPSFSHLLGTDDLGRDMLSRLLYAYRVSLLISVGSVGVALLVGTPIGLAAGYWGGWVDSLLMRPIDIMLCFPALLLAFTLITILGPSTYVALLAIALIFVPVLARVMRASVLSVASMTYVDAARSRGTKEHQIMLRHVLPNAIGAVVVQCSILAGIAIQIEAALSFVGLGAQPPTPSLGVMLSDGIDYFSLAPGLEIYPGVAIAISVLGFLLLGQGLRDRLDPRGVLR